MAKFDVQAGRKFYKVNDETSAMEIRAHGDEYKTVPEPKGCVMRNDLTGSLLFIPLGYLEPVDESDDDDVLVRIVMA